MKTPSPAPIIVVAKSGQNPLLNSISNKNSFHLRSPSLNSLRLRRIFDQFDTNHDSFITIQEITQALSLLGLHTNTSDLESVIKPYVKPGNVGLTYDDFVKLHQSINDMLVYDVDENSGSEEEQEEADLREAFKVFDDNGDGFISASELQMVLGKLGFSEANEIGRVKMMISSVDMNHDGRVDFSEFKDMMKALDK